MHGVARRDDNLAMLQNDVAVFDFEIMVPLDRGGEVVMGRNVEVFLSELGVGQCEFTIEYSHDFGVTFAEDLNVGAIICPIGGAVADTAVARGTNTRISVLATAAAGSLINVECHLV